MNDEAVYRTAPATPGLLNTVYGEYLLNGSDDSQSNEPEPEEEVDLLVDDVDWEDAETVKLLDTSGGTVLVEGALGHLEMMTVMAQVLLVLIPVSTLCRALHCLQPGISLRRSSPWITPRLRLSGMQIRRRCGVMWVTISPMWRPRMMHRSRLIRSSR